MLSFFSHPSTFKVFAIWFQDFFSLSGLYNHPLYNIEVGFFPTSSIFFCSISSGVRFAMVMISDDGGKTPLTFCGFYEFPGNLALKCPWTVLTWAKSDPLIGSGQKIASGKRQSRIQSYFRVSRWTRVPDPLAARQNAGLVSSSR